MSYQVPYVDGILHECYEEPECICFRDVINDAQVSPWFEWQGIKQDLTLEEFEIEIEHCNLSRDKLVLRAYEDGNGIILDYGLRHQFWIPQKIANNWDLSKLRVELSDRIEEEIRKGEIKIKPCPFCGDKANLEVWTEHRYDGEEGFMIICHKCGMNTATPSGMYHSNKDGVIASWNQRVDSYWDGKNYEESVKRVKERFESERRPVIKDTDREWNKAIYRCMEIIDVEMGHNSKIKDNEIKKMSDKAQEWLNNFNFSYLGEESDKMIAIIREALQEYPKYHETGTVEEFKALKEKAEPKKPMLDWES